VRYSAATTTEQAEIFEVAHKQQRAVRETTDQSVFMLKIEKSRTQTDPTTISMRERRASQHTAEGDEKEK
jgi:hypothetical protein